MRMRKKRVTMMMRNQLMLKKIMLKASVDVEIEDAAEDAADVAEESKVCLLLLCCNYYLINTCVFRLLSLKRL